MSHHEEPPTIRYESVEELFQAIRETSGDFLVVTGLFKFFSFFFILSKVYVDYIPVVPYVPAMALIVRTGCACLLVLAQP